MTRTLVSAIGMSVMLAVTVGCSTNPVELGVTAAGDAFFGLFGFGSLSKSHADDTFLIEKTVVIEATLHALDVMTLHIEETIEEDDTTTITGVSRSSKAPMKFSANVREISSNVTNVSIRAGWGILKPDHSTAEEIMNQLVLRLNATTSSTGIQDETQSAANPDAAGFPIPTALTSEAAGVMHASTTASPYVVQVGSYRTKENADRHVGELRNEESQPTPCRSTFPLEAVGTAC